ncbi:MAG: ATP-dependent RecD-like DNA helicase [Anaeroplasmataceae bacterium]|nr:ATP-dependent RecD-like DNA helicase [Anaeroplasmataceae bacterium]
MSEIIYGSIDSYIYKSEDSLYKVARVKTKKEEIVIVGSFIELEEGLEYEFVGEFIEHSKYGKQFKVESYARSNSFSKDGLIAYLSSEKFFGIGQKLAKNIVEHLGLDCIQKILDNPDSLDEVSLITEAKKKVVVETLKQNYATEAVVIKLYSFGLTNKMVYRLYDAYGTEAAIRIEDNPYSLIYDVEGFGFKKSDALALKLGFEENDKLRLREAIRYTLNTVSYQQGYTFLTSRQLLNSSYILLGNNPMISMEDLSKALENLVLNEKIIQDQDRYFDPLLYKSEIRCAEAIQKLKKHHTREFSKDKIKESIQDVQKDLSITYTDLQEEAIFKALSNKLSIITGGPGTGKSTIINGILRSYAILNHLTFPCDELNYKVMMMAPTGRAAKRMTEVTNFKATTIHKALGYNYEGGFTYSEESPLSCSLVIIDESSMIDINLAASLFKAIPLSARVILVGDENQLPSVGPGNVFHDLIASNLFATVKLFEIMRQARDSNIVKLSHMVFSGEVDFRLFSDKKEVYFYPCDAKSLNQMLFKMIDAYLATGNSLQTGMQILIPMYAGIVGIDAVNEAITARYNPSEEKLVRDYIILKKNDKVLQLKNDPTLQLMNGDIGIIKGITKINEKDTLLIDFDGRMVSYPGKEVDNLRLAYAISIHKSQGSEYENVILPILPNYHMMLRKKIIYTALTRAKKKLILLGDIHTLKEAVKALEPQRQTGLLNLLQGVRGNEIKILDSTIPFDTLGEYDMEDITPYSFME